jgi:hypothetical protein
LNIEKLINYLNFPTQEVYKKFRAKADDETQRNGGTFLCGGKPYISYGFIRNYLGIYKGIANRTGIYKEGRLLFGIFQFYHENDIPLFILNILYMA